MLGFVALSPPPGDKSNQNTSEEQQESIQFPVQVLSCLFVAEGTWSCPVLHNILDFPSELCPSSPKGLWKPNLLCFLLAHQIQMPFWILYFLLTDLSLPCPQNEDSHSFATISNTSCLPVSHCQLRPIIHVTALPPYPSVVAFPTLDSVSPIQTMEAII